MARLLRRRGLPRRYLAVFFAGEVGSPRLLKLFARLGIKTTWFIPGHSLETFPAEMKAVAEAGHEIGIHGYLTIGSIRLASLFLTLPTRVRTSH
jgi:peptidoglycan/xylan/chitin deacetylase (PgdA/CDA1 family)